MSMMQYFRFFQDLWRFFKAHADPVSADSWWQRFADEADQLADRYDNTEFAVRMISAVVWEIDKTYRERTIR